MSIPIPLEGEGSFAHLTICPRCGSETQELVIGAMRAVVERASKKPITYYQKGRHRYLPKELQDNRFYETRPVEDLERIPCSICDNCQNILDTVRAGGIFFKCKECKLEGAIKPSNPICAEVREKSGITAPDPVGIEFDTCDQHGGKPE